MKQSSFLNKQKLYKDTFNTPSGEKVLADLASFCGQFEPTYRQGDPYDTAYREGMRRVYLRINSFLNKDEQELNALVSQLRKDMIDGTY